jgi:hypothetical protein
MKPVQGFLLQVGQGKELQAPVRHELECLARPIQPESYYVVHVDKRGTCIIGGPYPTEERAFGDISAITDTSGT